MRDDDATGAGRLGGAQAIRAIFENQHFSRRHREALRRELINVREWFPPFDILACQDEVKTIEKSMRTKDLLNELRTGRGGDATRNLPLTKMIQEQADARHERAGPIAEDFKEQSPCFRRNHLKRFDEAEAFAKAGQRLSGGRAHHRVHEISVEREPAAIQESPHRLGEDRLGVDQDSIEVERNCLEPNWPK